jgi:hypothetical protein
MAPGAYLSGIDYQNRVTCSPEVWNSTAVPFIPEIPRTSTAEIMKAKLQAVVDVDVEDALEQARSTHARRSL